jgi:phosphoglycolate phosphatase
MAMFPATVTHVLFDLDGTLTDPYEGITKCVDFALERLGVARPDGDLHWLIGPPLHESFQRLLGTKDEDVVWNAVSIYRERYSTLGKFENLVYPGIIDALARLKAQGLKLFVATSKAELYAREIVSHFGLDSFFEKVYGSEMNGGRTAKGDLLAYLLEQEGFSAETSLMVGDRKHDVIGSQRCGLACGGVLWGYGSVEELSGAGAVKLYAAPAELI